MLDFSKYLNDSNAEKLNKYVQEELLDDLSFFNDYYGYKGNKSLIHWLVIVKVFPLTTIKFIKNRMRHILRPNTLFVHKKRLLNNQENYSIGAYTVAELIPMFTPFLEIGSDGIGGYYYTTMTEEDNGIIYYDHEGSQVYAVSSSFQKIIRKHPIKKIAEVLEIITSTEPIIKYLNAIKYKSDHPKYNINRMSNYLTKFMLSIEGEHTYRFHHKYRIPYSPFNSNGQLREFITATENPYDSYDNIRLATTAQVISNLYYYYLSGQINELKNLIEASQNIQGSYFIKIVQVFRELLEGDFSKSKFTFAQLQPIREKTFVDNPRFKNEELLHYGQ